MPIFGRVDAERFVLGFDHADFEAVFEGAQLFQSFGLFERADGEVGVSQQKIAPVDVEADVFEVGRGRVGRSRVYKEWASARNRARCLRDR